ncbi:5,6-dimethylbenzimidazole synthase [Nitratireductor sp. ZSWI3]|uniref:5,6-dimethylbenzimidazole synthase n=1 Tax=Nitratireductor sp. ZSWI3 TaxID=2966359 RepID=UPI0021505C4E|nr:5,6-dimethylbenzimidazole synthase [Nitratireductor sp. ZSWI3]MCR4267794.1 5,6-dimethylbenzimidazole synthase [Nitratireductor sp. ZSWI3]
MTGKTSTGPVSPPVPPLAAGTPFSEEERLAVYRAITTRRDVRGEFLPDPVDDATLSRILAAAHSAPSVGLSQPWDFILIRNADTRRKIADIFTDANREAAGMFPPDKQPAYNALKLEGILTAPLNICVTSDPDRGGPVVLGATHMRDTDLFSTVCAIQNLWLAARAEGIGVGWVSILDPQRVKTVLGIPERIRLVGYLCVGHVKGFFETPELEQRGWRRRTPLEELVHDEAWEAPAASLAAVLQQTKPSSTG